MSFIEKVWIDKTGKRNNPHRALEVLGVAFEPGQILLPGYEEFLAEIGFREVDVDVRPADYSDDTHDRRELDPAPYIEYQRRGDDQIRAIRWVKIKAKRDDLTENGGCLVAGKWFHSDIKSKQQQIALVLSGANLPQGLEWKTMDGSKVVMTSELATQIFAAQILREQTIFAHAESLKNDLSADISAGWPAAFPG